MKKKNDSLKKICAVIKKYKRFLLSSHIDPEGDSVCSLLVLHSMLKKLKKEVVMVCDHPIPKDLSFLASSFWKLTPALTKQPNFEACIIVDCPSLERVGRVKNYLSDGKFIINIDHHISNTHFGDVNYVDEGASSCGEILYELFGRLNLPISKKDALHLYVSISTDTGSFKYGNTTAKTHRIVATLIQKGINTESLNEKLYGDFTPAKIRLLGRVLNLLNFDCGGRLVCVKIPNTLLQEVGATHEDTEGLVEFLRGIRTVEVAILLSEYVPNTKTKVSLRSKGSIDVNKLARKFGGGGHKKAAGCTLRGNLDETEVRILNEVKKELRG